MLGKYVFSLVKKSLAWSKNLYLGQKNFTLVKNSSTWSKSLQPGQKVFSLVKKSLGQSKSLYLGQEDYSVVKMSSAWSKCLLTLSKQYIRNKKEKIHMFIYKSNMIKDYQFTEGPRMLRCCLVDCFNETNLYKLNYYQSTFSYND